MVRVDEPQRVSRRRCLSWIVALGPGGAGPSAAAQDNDGKAEANEWRPWPARRAVPPLALSRLDGGRFDLRELRGRPVLLNFWATWCAPCREEMPSLARLARARARDGLVVVAVNYRESAAVVRRFVGSLVPPLPPDMAVVLDDSGEAAKAWTPRIFPTTVFIDRRGRPLGSLVGECDWDGPGTVSRLAPLLAPV